MKWILTVHDGRFATFLNGYLPVLALLVLIMLLPVIFQQLSLRYERRKSYSEIQKSILRRFFLFQLSNIYVTVTAGSVWRSLGDIVENPSKGFQYFGAVFPTMVGYFISFLIVKILGGLPMVLLRLGAVLRLAFLNMLCGKRKTQRQVDNVYKKQELLYGWEYPNALLVLVVSFTYACISPLILIFSAIYFFFALIVYMNQVVYVYANAYEGGGLLFRVAVNRIFVGLTISQVILMGYLLTREGFFPPLILLPLPFFTLWTMKCYEEIYFERSLQLSLERAQSIDRLSIIHDPFANDVYRQPLLTEAPVHPLPLRH